MNSGAEAAGSILDRVQRDIADAMRARNEHRLSVLRMAKTALKKREVDQRKPLEESEAHQVIGTLIKQRRDAAEQFRKGGREDLAAKEEADIPVLEEYVPAAPSDSDIDAVINAAIAETGAASVKQMGVVMKTVTAQLAGRPVDNKKLSEKVRARLGG